VIEWCEGVGINRIDSVLLCQKIQRDTERNCWKEK